MKVLLVNKYHYYNGGSETYHFALDELLRKHGHQVIHFAMQDDANLPSPTSRYFIPGIDYNNIGGTFDKIRAIQSMFYSKVAFAKMNDLLTDEKPDIVHMGLVHKQITYSIVEAIRAHNIPIVQSVHDLVFTCPCYTMLTNNENCELCVEGSKWNCVKKRCVKGSTLKSLLSVIEDKYIRKNGYYDLIDTYITECSFYQSILERSKFSKSRIMTIANFLPPSKAIELNTYRGEYLLYFGRFSPEKGIITLLKAYHEAQINIPLVLVGGGPIESEIREYTTMNGLQEKVKFAGYVYGKEMEGILSKAMAVIVPSEWYENAPYSILEAMAKSRPVIASNIAGLPELVKNGETGYLFNPRDTKALAKAICTLASLDENQYESMCRSSFNHIKAIGSPEGYYTQLMDLYTQVIERNH